MSVKITDVKIVGLCLKHRGNEPAPRNKYGELWDEKDIACISCAIVGYDGADETVAENSKSNFVQKDSSYSIAPQQRQEHDVQNLIINRLKELLKHRAIIEHSELGKELIYHEVNEEGKWIYWNHIQEIIDEFEVKE